MTLRKSKYQIIDKNWKERQMLILNIHYFESKTMNDWVYIIQQWKSLGYDKDAKALKTAMVKKHPEWVEKHYPEWLIEIGIIPCLTETIKTFNMMYKGDEKNDY